MTVRKTEACWAVGRFMVLVAALLGLTIAVGSCSGDEPEQEQGLGVSFPIRINSTMFVAPRGGEWVERFTPSATAVSLGGVHVTSTG